MIFFKTCIYFHELFEDPYIHARKATYLLIPVFLELVFLGSTLVYHLIRVVDVDFFEEVLSFGHEHSNFCFSFQYLFCINTGPGSTC